MVLKKQTVWLLTMLSLIIVLSVYYMTSPGKPASTALDTSSQVDEAQNKKDVITTTATDDKMAEYRIKHADAQSKLEKEYQGVIDSDKSSTQAVSKAYDKLESLKTVASNEKLLEDVIKSKGYSDAVVMADGESVQVVVATKSLSNKQANTIMKLANEYLGADKLVKVDYELTKK
ncbi:stage III sporulation protein AH [Terrilactibacillus sp. BCM23-1]|uniref:Stage III sporulation protein AH n=1 Tax=Terrilactibacillus tamarindi TaxID=2599694 RepID=A0A6N8CU83_9BACI|nr:SpoIIIAH-like family protein [Terrilactibacillus tamarindi]MTT32683.1 stage III sporulation protein AH [Terrilactibacillus tamarindi]